MVERPKPPVKSAAPSSKGKTETSKGNDFKQNIKTKAPELKKSPTIAVPSKAVEAKNKLESRTRHHNCVDRKEHTIEIAEWLKSVGSYPHGKSAFEKAINSQTDYLVKALLEKANQEYQPK